MTLKISVFSSGALLADGVPVDFDRLEESLRAVKEAGGLVWYYREQTKSAEELGMKVMALVVKHKLPIRLSSRPDFSDWVDAKGVSHPLAPGGDMEEIFVKARSTAAGEKGPCGVVMVRPDGRFLVTPALQATPSLDAMAAGMERLIPSAVKRNVAVIADTGFAAGQAAPSLNQANQAIPFFGLLTGLCYVGHHVWVFNGQPSMLAAGCREADVLIVDSGMTASLAPGWENTAVQAMRNANIVLHDRATCKLRFLRRAGESRDRLEFPH